VVVRMSLSRAPRLSPFLCAPVNLPCIVEVHKTLDRITLYKTGDVGQVTSTGMSRVMWSSV
jgi:hypothetical protein